MLLLLLFLLLLLLIVGWHPLIRDWDRRRLQTIDHEVGGWDATFMRIITGSERIG